MPPPFTDVGAVFPSKGLERTCEFGRQPADTAPDGENVLSEESITSRVRGGSRPGLSKYINETVVGDFVVQHLNVLVDPQATALRAETSTPGGVPDPSTNNVTMRNPGRVVTSGGSGRVPNRNIPETPETADPVIFVQAHREQPGATATHTLTLPSQPVANSLVLVFIHTTKPGSSYIAPTLVTNDNLNEYTQAGGSGFAAEFLSNLGVLFANHLSCWTKRATAGEPDKYVRVTLSANATLEISVIEVRNTSAIAPVFEEVEAVNEAAVSQFSPGSIALNNTVGQMIAVAYIAPNTGIVPDGSYVPRVGSGSGISANMSVATLGGLSGAGTETPTATPTVARPFGAIAIGLTK